MPGGLLGGGKGSSRSSNSSAPQPTGIGVSTPGYTFGTGVNNQGQITSNLSTGGSLGQNLFQSFLPQAFNTLGTNAAAAGNAGQQYLSDIGYSTTGTPDPNAPFLSPLTAIENARNSALSTLSDSLARRGVLGSSFGSDALARQD